MVTCTVSPLSRFPHIYFLFTVRLTNERVGVFLARRSVQHLVNCSSVPPNMASETVCISHITEMKNTNRMLKVAVQILYCLTTSVWILHNVD